MKIISFDGEKWKINNFTTRASQLRNNICNQIKNERVISMVILKERKFQEKKRSFK